ncbi:AAA family ATPase [Candidatus Woesearchaeota archaeon]|nr:AAA family ATPase [Candidatus Woesearchaeota archaeon]
MTTRFVTLIVTGTPGTGKTTLAKKLSLLLSYTHFDVGSFVKNAHIYSSYDRKRHTYVVDEAKLARSRIKVRQKALRGGRKGIILDSHMSHYLPKKYADLCLVARCSLKTLQHRLRRKGYSQAKVRENLNAEIFDTCLSEAKEMGHRIVAFDTTTAKTADVKAFAAKIRKLLT